MAPTARELISNNTGVQIAIGGTFTVAKPASLADNDEIRLFICGNNTTFTITPPADWTLVNSATNAGNNLRMYIYSRKIGTVGAEPAWTFTVNVTATRILVYGHAFGGAGTGTTNNSMATGVGLTPATASVNNPVVNSVAIMVVYHKINATNELSAWSAPLVEDGEQADSSGNMTGLSRGTVAATGATGAKQCTAVDSRAWIAALLLVENVPIVPCKALMGVGV